MVLTNGYSFVLYNILHNAPLILKPKHLDLNRRKLYIKMNQNQSIANFDGLHWFGLSF